VVLLDIGMPRMDGYEVARRLREMPGMENALLVAITGYDNDAELRRCKEAGINCHFIKPVDPDDLRKVLAKAGQVGRDHWQLAC
jgi:two-component system CheB/CheR fusion protein